MTGVEIVQNPGDRWYFISLRHACRRARRKAPSNKFKRFLVLSVFLVQRDCRDRGAFLAATLAVTIAAVRSRHDQKGRELDQTFI